MSSSRVTLRIVQPSDMYSVWEWNSALPTRAASLSTEPIALEQHRRWFAKRLVDLGSTMFIVESDGAAVGSVRFQREHGVATVSIALSGAVQGRGVGRAAVAAACVAHRANYPAVAIEAQILEDNKASLRCFEAAEFVSHARRKNGGRWQVSLRYLPVDKGGE